MRLRDKNIVLKDKVFELYIDQKQIDDVLEDLAREINHDYQGKKLIVLGIMDGAVMVVADLVRKLELDLTISLMRVKSYEGMGSTGQVQILGALNNEIKDSHVLILEDIIDTGNTLSFLIPELKKQQPKSIEIATFLMKDEVFNYRFPVRYKGLSIENRFVVGYGMDYDGEGRQLSNIYALKSH